MKQEYDLKWLFDNFSGCSISTETEKGSKVFIEIPLHIFKIALEEIKWKKSIEINNK